MPVNTLLKVLEQLLHKIKANRRREMPLTKKKGKGAVQYCMSHHVDRHNTLFACICHTLEQNKNIKVLETPQKSFALKVLCDPPPPPDMYLVEILSWRGPFWCIGLSI